MPKCIICRRPGAESCTTHRGDEYGPAHRGECEVLAWDAHWTRVISVVPSLSVSVSPVTTHARHGCRRVASTSELLCGLPLGAATPWGSFDVEGT